MFGFVLFGDSSPEAQALGWSAVALTLGTLIANAWGVWVRRLEKRDEQAAVVQRAAQDAGIIELKGDVEHLTEKIGECEKDRSILHSEVKGLREMILGKHVGEKDLAAKVHSLEAAVYVKQGDNKNK